MNKKKLIENLENIIDLYILWQKYSKFNKKSMKRKKNKENNKTRNMEGFFKTCFIKIKELDAGQFFIYTRMNRHVFNLLLSMIEEKLKKKSIREPIAPECRLALTILFLSQGDSFQSPAWSWKMGKETVRCIIYETCEIIWNTLKELFVPEPTVQELKKTSEDFWKMWNLPNCIGAIDGKHIAIVRPSNSMSEYHNYKKFYSIVLLAVCDANYKFTYIDIGAYGSQSDGGIFHASSFGKRILEEKLVLPQPDKLPNSTKILPHFFVADAAFPLHPNIMKPYPGSYFSKSIEYYNMRISRARRVIENSFGILTARWRVLLKTLHMSPENAEKIVLACIALHNFLREKKESKNVYMPPRFVDWIDDQSNEIDGLWRNEVDRNLPSILPSRSRHTYRRNESKDIREQLHSFVNNEGKI